MDIHTNIHTPMFQAPGPDPGHVQHVRRHHQQQRCYHSITRISGEPPFLSIVYTRAVRIENVNFWSIVAFLFKTTYKKLYTVKQCIVPET